MENKQNKNIVSTENDGAQKLDVKLDQTQIEQLVWMAMLGIQASNWYLDLMEMQLKGYHEGDSYWEDRIQTQHNIQEVKAVIDEMVKVADITLESITPKENFLESSLKELGVLVSSECKKIR